MPQTLESRPSLGALELLGRTDPPAFAGIMEDIGLQILGVETNDPLERRTMPESVDALSTMITESIDENRDIDPYIQAVMEMARALGFIVGVGD